MIKEDVPLPMFVWVESDNKPTRIMLTSGGGGCFGFHYSIQNENGEWVDQGGLLVTNDDAFETEAELLRDMISTRKHRIGGLRIREMELIAEVMEFKRLLKVKE
jgi:hypothetical protein